VGLTCTHDASLAAVHAHSRAATTFRVMRPPAAGSVEGGVATLV
jgi:hypothetical protein